MKRSSQMTASTALHLSLHSPLHCTAHLPSLPNHTPAARPSVVHSALRCLALSPTPHPTAVRCAALPPCLIQVWDIASARVLRDDWRHEQRVTGIEFHPYEFIMATSSADRTVRVWDLELWEPVEALGPEATGVRAIAYHRDGRQLLCATADALKVWGCEPAVHHDTVPIDWRQLGDMHLSYKDDAPRAVGCCCSGSSVGVFLVDLRKVAPFCGTTVAGATGAAAAQQQMGLLRSAVAGGGTGDCAVSGPVPSTGDQRSLSQQHDKDDYGDDDQQQQQQRVLVGAQPQPPLLLSASNASTKAAGGGPLMRQLGRQRTPPRPPSSSSAFVAVKALQPQTGQLQQQQQQPGQLPRAAATDAAVPLHQPPQMQQEQQRQHLGTRRQASDSFPEYAVEIRLPPGPPPLPGAAGAMAPPNGGASGRSSRRTSGLAADASAAGLHALSVTDGAVLPVCSGGASSGSSTRASAAPSPRAAEHAAVGVADAAASGDAILAAMAARPLLKAELARMAGGLQLARGFVVRGNLEGAYRSAAQASDAALASMLVEAVSCRQDAFELSTLEPLIKLLELLLSSGVEAHAAAGLSALSLVLRGPGATVREVCAGPGPLGVDLSYEARKSRCSLVKLALEGLGMRVGALSRGAGALAARARLVSDELRAVVGGGV